MGGRAPVTPYFNNSNYALIIKVGRCKISSDMLKVNLKDAWRIILYCVQTGIDIRQIDVLYTQIVINKSSLIYIII